MKRSDGTHDIEHNGGRPERPVAGDPGIGGILTDPLAPTQAHDEPDPSAGPVSPDPGPPRNHGDWMPTSKDDGGRPPSRAAGRQTSAKTVQRPPGC